LLFVGSFFCQSSEELDYSEFELAELQPDADNTVHPESAAEAPPKTVDA